MAKRTGNPHPKPPSSGGIPSGETLWIPSHYSVEVRRKGGLDKTIYWDVGDVVDFVFPRKYQPTYFKVACDFVGLILDKGTVTKDEIREFLKASGYSKPTLENKVIPKLVKFGLLKREREVTSGQLGRGRALVLTESLTFSNYLEKIAFAWNVLVSTSRKKRVKEDSLQP